MGHVITTWNSQQTSGSARNVLASRKYRLSQLLIAIWILYGLYCVYWKNKTHVKSSVSLQRRATRASHAMESSQTNKFTGLLTVVSACVLGYISELIQRYEHKFTCPLSFISVIMTHSLHSDCEFDRCSTKSRMSQTLQHIFALRSLRMPFIYLCSHMNSVRLLSTRTCGHESLEDML